MCMYVCCYHHHHHQQQHQCDLLSSEAGNKNGCLKKSSATNHRTSRHTLTADHSESVNHDETNCDAVSHDACMLRNLLLHSTGSVRLDCGRAAKFHRQWTDHLEQSATFTTSTRAAVTEHLKTCTEDAPVLDHPAPSRCFLCNSGTETEYDCTD